MDQQPTQVPPPNVVPPRETVGPDYWRRPHRRWPLYALGLLIILVASGLFWLWQHPKKPTPNSNQAVSNQGAAKTSTSPASPATQSYSSSNFNLSFNYPSGWTVTDSGNGQLTVRSPATSLIAATGQKVDGEIIMTIAQQGQNLAAFNSGDAVAVLDSQKIAYSQPTQSQRADTYLSFLQYANTTTAGALDGVYITGDFGYQKGQVIPKTDVAKIDPLVSVTFVKCASSACPAGTATAMNIGASSWNSSSFTPTLNMLKSLSFN